MLLLAVAALAPSVVSPAASEPSVRAAWWNESNTMLDGWHVRIPFTVENPLDRDVIDATVGYDLRVKEALLDAGWPRSTSGTLQVFRLDTVSVRVVEYRALGGTSPYEGVIVGEVPSRARSGLLESLDVFDPETAPDLHVEWVLPGITTAGGERAFMVYLDTTAHEAKPRAAYEEAAAAPLEARYWIGRGTLLYGMASEVTLVGIEDDTRVSLAAYVGGRAVAIETGSPDGVVALDRKSVRTLSVQDEPVVVRVTSNKPVLAHGDGAIVGPVPSLDGQLRGTEFAFHDAGNGYLVLATGGVSSVTTDQGSFQLTPGTPVRAVGTNCQRNVLNTVTTTDPTRPLMVFIGPPETGKVQFPSETGAPTGSRLATHPFVARACTTTGPPAAGCAVPGRRTEDGEVVVAGFDAPAYVRGRDWSTRELRLPADETGRGSSQSGRVEAAGTLQLLTFAGTTSCPIRLYTTGSVDDASFADTGRVAAFGGGDFLNGGATVLTPTGGLSATEFLLPAPAHVVAPYDGTLVAIERDGKVAKRGLGSSDLLERVDASIRGPTRITASKPVVILPLEPGAYFAGIDRSPVVRDAGALEYRGYLVSLAPAGRATEPMVAVAAPGKAVDYRLLVSNLALDHRGTPVTDTIELTVPPVPPGWNVSLSETVVRLPGGASREATLRLVPPPDAAEGSRLATSITATSLGNPAIRDRVPVVGLVRANYEVDAWFERENGPKSRTLTLEEGAARTLDVVVKNLATVDDEFLVKANLLARDWKTRFADGRDFAHVALGPGESARLTLLVEAPPAQASQSVLEVTATSGGSAAATEKIAALLRVKPEIDIALDVADDVVEAAPSSVAKFRVVFRNAGRDAVSVQFNLSSHFPDGWIAPSVKHGEETLDELSGIPGGTSVDLDVVVAIPPEALRTDRARLRLLVETLPQFVGDPVLSTEADLHLVVGRRHALHVLEGADIVALDDRGRARLAINFENAGNGPEVVRFVPHAVPSQASLGLDPPVDVSIGDRATIGANLVLPFSTPPGILPFPASIETADGYVVPVGFNVSVPILRRAEMTPLGPPGGPVGRNVSVDVRLKNVGNVELALPPLFSGGNATVRWTGERESLEPGHVVTGRLEVFARGPGSFPLTFDPAWGTGSPVPWRAWTVRLETTEVEPGGPGTVRVVVANRGTGDAADVAVELTQGGRAIDRVHLARVPGGEEIVAILGGAGPGEVLVEVDPAGVYGPPVRTTLVLRESPSTIPDAGGLALLGVLVILAARRP